MNKREALVLGVNAVFNIGLLLVIAYEVIKSRESVLVVYGYALIIQLTLFVMSMIVTIVMVVKRYEGYEERKKIVSFFVMVAFILYAIGLGRVLLREIDFHWLRGMTLEEWKYQLMHGINLKPFLILSGYRKYTEKQYYMMQLFGNIVLFVPYGILLPILRERVRKSSRFFAKTLILITLVEVTQFITQAGELDIDDVILNMIGAAVGYGVYKLPIMQKMFKKFYIC